MSLKFHMGPGAACAPASLVSERTAGNESFDLAIFEWTTGCQPFDSTIFERTPGYEPFDLAISERTTGYEPRAQSGSVVQRKHTLPPPYPRPVTYFFFVLNSPLPQTFDVFTYSY